MSTIKIIYILGNPLVSIDRSPVKLLPRLQRMCPQFSFVHIDPTEEIKPDESGDLVLIDTVIGINAVTVFHNFNNISLSSRASVHDYDVPLNVGLLQKLGKIKNIVIIGVPLKGKTADILKDVINALYIHFTFKK